MQLQAALADLDDASAAVLLADWPLWARAEQLPPPGSWFVWLILAGRGWGKTRTGAEYIRWRVESGQASRIALIGETAADVRDVMIEGESGLLAVSPSWNRPLYEPSKRRVTWPNGAMAFAYSGEDPDQLRGPQHDTAWADEVAKWRYVDDAWSNLEFGLRLGQSPQVVATTTPRPIPLLRRLMVDPMCVRPTSNLSTTVNQANVSPLFVQRVISRYAGTRLGRQELEAELLDDTPGALWTLRQIEAGRAIETPTCVRIAVGVDPPGSVSTECGIVVAGCEEVIHGTLAAAQTVTHGYVLADRSLLGDPGVWAEAVIRAYLDYQADVIVVEANQGGNMVEHTIRNTTITYEGRTILGANLPIVSVWATRGKYLRAEPIAILYGNDQLPIRVRHVGAFPLLENEMTTYVPGEQSPNRLDALVWALTHLFPNEEHTADAGYATGGQRPLMLERSRR